MLLLLAARQSHMLVACREVVNCMTGSSCKETRVSSNISWQCGWMPPAGDKSESKALMTAAGVHVVPGYHGEDQTLDRSVTFLVCVSALPCQHQ